MKISFEPQRRDGRLVVHRHGDVLDINGQGFDFSLLPDGSTIPAGVVPCEWIIGPVEKSDGRLHLTLLLPHGPQPSGSVAFPVSLIDPPNGELSVPFDLPINEEQASVDA